MFSPGDIVVYHHHVCEVVSIREGYFEGKDYFELHALFENSLKLFVAIDDAAPPALRPTMTRKEALSLIDSIADAESIDVDALRPGANTPVLLDRHIREEYDRHLKTFAPKDLIPIMKSVRERTLRRTDSGRQITATDKKYLELAEGLLCDELSISLDMERDSVKDFLAQCVEKSETRR
ncbi:CarD family transcriptional regulator [Gordonibacter sp.]|uniref:CarD family transcriptional regulator n=1 Tax=Gordonibacter sp. TaxID=1968902 RepID=UPI002FC65710